MISGNHIIAKIPDSITKIIDDEAIIILPIQGQVKVFNQVGARIWVLLDGESKLSDVIDIICHEYSVSRQVAEQDTLQFVQRLVDNGMLVIVK